MNYDTDTGDITAYVDKSELSNYDKIIVSGSFAEKFKPTIYNNKEFIYCRDIGTVSDSSTYVIDNSNNQTKQLTLSVDDSSKSDILKGADLKVSSSYGTETSGYIVDASNTNIWVDPGTYEFSLQNIDKRYLLSSSINTASNGWNVVFNTTNVSTFSIDVNNINNYTSGDVYFNAFDSAIEVQNGDKIYITPNSGISVNGFNLESYDSLSRDIYKYYYTYEYEFKNKEDKILQLDDFSLVSDTKNVTYNSPESMPMNISIMSGDAELTNIEADNIVDESYPDLKNWKELKLSLYDSNNNFVKFLKYQRQNNSFLGRIAIDDPSIPAGNYSIHVDLPSNAKNVNNNIFQLKVDTSNLLKIKVVDPFDNNKVVKNVSFKFKMKDYGYNGLNPYFGDDGYYYIDKSSIDTTSDIYVSFDDNNCYFNYSYKINTTGNEIVINKSLKDLKNVNVIHSAVGQILDLDNATFSLGTDVGEEYPKDYTLYLDNNKTYKYALSSTMEGEDNVFLLTGNINTSTDSDIMIDDSKLAVIESNKNIAVGSSDCEWTVDGTKIYVSPDKKYNYRYYNDNYKVATTGEIDAIGSGEIKTLNFDDNLSIDSDFNSTQLKPNQSVNVNVYLKDKYGNVYSSYEGTSAYAIFKQNNNVVKQIVMGNNSGNSYQLNVADVYGQAQLYFELHIGDKVYDTKTYDVTVDTTGMIKLQFTGPNGEPVNCGQIYFTSSNNWLQNPYNTDKNGTLYIDKDDSLNNDNMIVVKGKTSDNKTFIYTNDFNYNDDNNLKESYVPTDKFSDINFKINNCNNSDNNYSSQKNLKIYFNNSKGKYYIYNIGLDTQNQNDILIQNGNYSFDLKSDYNNKDCLLSEDNININKDQDIVFDAQNASQINVMSNGKCIPNVNIRVYNTDNDYDLYSNGYYLNKGLYKHIDLSYSNSNMSLSLKRDSLINVNKDNTIIDIGKLKAYIDNSELYNDGNLNIGNIRLQSDNEFCSESFDIYNSDDTQEKAKINVTYSKDGKLIKTINPDMYKDYDLSDLSEGVYDVKFSIDLPDFGVVESDDKKILVAKQEDSYNINIYNSNNDDNAKIAIMDGSKEILNFNSIDNYGIYVPKSMLSIGKTYGIYVNNCHCEDIIIDNDGNINYNSDNIEKYNSYTIKGLKTAVINILKDGNNYETFNYISNVYGSDGETVNLPDGKYNLIIIGQDVNDNNVVLNRTINVTDDYNSNVLDVSSISATPVQITNGFNGDYTIYKFTDAEGNEIGRINSQNMNDNKIYMDPGTYNITACESQQNGTASIYENYTENISAANNTINIGSNIKTSAVLNKTSYNPNDSIGYSVNMTDGSANVCGDVSKAYSLKSIDIMHGSKVIKSVDKIYDYMAGDDTVRFTLSGPNGDIQSSNYNISVSGTKGKGDINLDGIVNIYDLVMMSKYMGKTSKDGDWDARCDLQKDNQIDILDITQNAKLYDTKY